MPENDPIPAAPAIKQALDDALRPMFGENLNAFYDEQERHDAEIRDLQARARRAGQELLDAALDRLTFFGGDRRTFLSVALENTQAQRADLDRELHEALVAAKDRTRWRIESLRIDVEDEE